MLSAIEIESKLKQIKPVLDSRFHVSKIGYFGSYSKGTQNDTSDLDLIVEFSEPIGWEFFTLEKYLEQVFGISIDLITQNALKERIKTSILNQVKYV